MAEQKKTKTVKPAIPEGNAVYLALHEAQKTVSNSSIKKEGRNKFAKYDYFTPEQVTNMVIDACAEHNLLTVFSMIQNELGIDGVLKIISLEDLSEIEILATVIGGEVAYGSLN